ncbi:uncharacterized protein DS421_20g698650 [Arachis hypogaea]|nr:uncharacterized protein DS421_20g698650 [Arachis hypogaea]
MEPHPQSHLSSLSTLHGLTLTASLSRLSPHLVSHHSQSLTASLHHSLGLALISSSSRSRAPVFRRNQSSSIFSVGWWWWWSSSCFVGVSEVWNQLTGILKMSSSQTLSETSPSQEQASSAKTCILKMCNMLIVLVHLNYENILY